MSLKIETSVPNANYEIEIQTFYRVHIKPEGNYLPYSFETDTLNGIWHVPLVEPMEYEDD